MMKKTLTIEEMTAVMQSHMKYNVCPDVLFDLYDVHNYVDGKKCNVQCDMRQCYVNIMQQLAKKAAAECTEEVQKEEE